VTRRRRAYRVARDRGISPQRVADLALSITGRPDWWTESMRDSFSLPFTLVGKLNDRDYNQVVDQLLTEPIDEERLAEYRRQDEEWAVQRGRDRKANARFMLEDPHLTVQREGWGS